MGYWLLKIWFKYFSIFYDLNNSEIIEQVIKFAILETEYVINPKFLKEIINF